MFAFQTTYLVESCIGDNGRTAGAVGADDDAFCIRITVSRLHAVTQHFDLVVHASTDFAFQCNDCRMLFACGQPLSGRAVVRTEP